MKYEKERCELIECARAMEHYGLVMLSGGKGSLLMKDGTFLVTPSAMAYDSMIPEDIVLVNGKGETIEGKRRPTSDLEAILYIFEKMPDVNVVLHTHQPKAVAVSLVTEEVPVISTTMVDELHDSVKVAPFTISSDKGMGVSTVEYAQKKGKAVILRQHGATLEQTLSSAVYLEETCEIYLSVLATGKKIPVLSEEQIKLEDAPRGYYGQ